jgi:Flp pilus assembly protein TadD
MLGAYYFFKKGKLLAQKGKLLDAIMMLEKAKDLEPKKGSIRELLACAYYNCGFYSSAKNNFIKALEIDATNDFAHYGLGICLMKERKINKAAGHLKMASAMKPYSKKYKEILKRIT